MWDSYPLMVIILKLLSDLMLIQFTSLRQSVHLMVIKWSMATFMLMIQTLAPLVTVTGAICCDSVQASQDTTPATPGAKESSN